MVTLRTAHVDSGLCIGCGRCVAACPENATFLFEGVASVDEIRCRGCGICSDSCPAGAISLLNSEVELLPVKREAKPVIAPPLIEIMPREESQEGGHRSSLLARVAKAAAPVAVNLVVAMGKAWLDRVSSEEPPESASSSATGERQRRRRRRWA